MDPKPTTNVFPSIIADRRLHKLSRTRNENIQEIFKYLGRIETYDSDAFYCEGRILIKSWYCGRGFRVTVGVAIL